MSVGLENQNAYIGLTAFLACVVVLTRVYLLWPGEYELTDDRWAGLRSSVVWGVWFVLIMLMIAAYSIFFSLFVANGSNAEKHKYYDLVCIFNVLFCVSESHWAYLLRQSEGVGKNRPWLSKDCTNVIEIVLTMPWSWWGGESKLKVMLCMFLSVVYSTIMLSLFCGGISGSEYTDNDLMIACSLAYMVFHLTFVDLFVWGVTWFHNYISDWKDSSLYIDTRPKLRERGVFALYSTTCPRLPPLRSRPIPPSLVSVEGVL
jgi:hypothetical protein